MKLSDFLIKLDSIPPGEFPFGNESRLELYHEVINAMIIYPLQSNEAPDFDADMDEFFEASNDNYEDILRDQDLSNEGMAFFNNLILQNEWIKEKLGL